MFTYNITAFAYFIHQRTWMRMEKKLTIDDQSNKFSNISTAKQTLFRTNLFENGTKTMDGFHGNISLPDVKANSIKLKLKVEKNEPLLRENTFKLIKFPFIVSEICQSNGIRWQRPFNVQGTSLLCTYGMTWIEN